MSLSERLPRSEQEAFFSSNFFSLLFQFFISLPRQFVELIPPFSPFIHSLPLRSSESKTIPCANIFDFLQSPYTSRTSDFYSLFLT